jgi:hypothetical protein
MRAGAFIGAACVVVALGGCEAILDFNVHPDAVPPDAPGPDAMLVPDPCTVLEPNDDVASAIQLTTGENRYAAICPATDLDFYKVSLVTGQTLDFKILFKNANGDLDMSLYDSTGLNDIADSRSFNDDEEIKCPNDPGMTPTCAMLAAGDYVVKVFPAVPGTTNVYRLDVTITP